MKHTTIKPVLKTWVKPDSNNEFGLYLRLTKDRKTSYVYLGIKCNQNCGMPIVVKLRMNMAVDAP
ncbi:MAG: hypothetical protein IPI15_01510 [Saprospiraceae bacterium]|uniref:hypothetical protein n=1 Tax=Candidatus Brachybacter algidus TaxID=2982024 RepID=UPI00257BBA15|nr:hypothetical protein [Candidatus Brachybacter algidus]MBK7602262.1 hypothetical protein [Candidatus Brachybacter algidus]